MKRALKEILRQTGVIAFLCSVMVLSSPNLNPDFAEWLTTLVTMRTGAEGKTAGLLLIIVLAIIGSVGLVANVLWEQSAASLSASPVGDVPEARG